MDTDAALIDPALSAHSSQTLPANPPRHISSASDDDDPVVATYQILLKPSKSAQHNLTILEAPNKIDPKKDRAPLELRTKPGTGMFEVDFPLDHSAAYDRNKGLNWGTALQKSTEAKKGGSHGLAGGFGVGAPPARAPRGGRGADTIDYGMEWTEALRRDMVLRTQTLGGQTPDAGAESGYMVAVFAGGNLHLTSASSLIHLRPQPHHIDAASEQERNARGISAGGAGSAPTKEAARAIHMTIKQSKDGGDDELVQETMADRLKKVQTETWRKMRYVHDESSDAWAMSEEVLYLDDAAKGKEAEGAGGHAAAELADKVAALSTGWREVSMLETTSGIQNPEAGLKVEISDDEIAGIAPAAASKSKGKGKATDAGVASASKAASKAKATASSSATTTTTRGKRSSTTTNNTAKASPSTKAKKSKS